MRTIFLALLVSILFTACNCADCQGVKVGSTWVDVGKPVTDASTYKVIKVDGATIFTIDGTGVTHRATLKDFTTYCIEKDSISRY
jgi:phosphatidate phosphatase PAH1